MDNKKDLESAFEIFPWDDHFCTGDSLIDEQHKQIVIYLNQLAAYFVQGKTAESASGLDDLFQGLIDYSHYHFKSEEAIWKDTFKQDPDFIEHCEIHQEFRLKVSEYAKQDHHEPGVLESLFGYLVHWLAFHILDSDRRMALCVQFVHQGMQLNEAKILADETVNGSLEKLINTVLGMYSKLSERTVDLIREVHARERAEIALKNVSQVLIEERLRNSEERFQALFFTIPEAIFVVDKLSGSLVNMNPAAEEICGFTVDKLLGKPFFTLFQTHDGVKFNQHSVIENTRHGSPLECLLMTATAEQNEVEISMGSSFEEEGVAYSIAVVRDISERIEHRKQLEFIAFHDALTHLPNKAKLIRTLPALMSCNDKFALVYFDFDNFLQINDLYGVEAGEQVIRKIASRLQKLFLEGEHIYHFGSDEFVILLNHFSDIPELEQQISMLFDEISRAVYIGKAEVIITSSAGVTVYPQSESCDPNTLIRQASQSMYQAKLKGSLRFHLFDDKEEKNTKSYYQTLERIQQGLKHNEFLLYYQPKVDLIEGEVVGLEALIRWNHPEKGVMLPGEFLHLIETFPLSIEVGFWVIETALAQMQSWVRQGVEMSVSVNLDGLQLQDSQFAEMLEQLLIKHPEVNPSNLQLEVLETTALEDLSSAVRTMKACRQLGVSIALDDFGTGHSSLSYLKQLPVQVLKIDKSFVKDLLISPSDRSILQSVVGLGKAFDIDVLAEGLESNEAGCLLIQMGCHLAQGYAIARPMPAAEVADWLQSWKAPVEWFQCKL
ncbi:MAG: EAL domain-containing protein [Oceanospirillales bacterium]|nr:MAG: EAL domain-containing protein [Oceanospirillales bacterium]